MQAVDTDIEWRPGPTLAPGWPTTLAALVAGCVARHGRRPVLIDGDQAWSWDRLERAAAALARDWGGAVGPGDRVVIRLPGGAPHLVAELAAWRRGAIAVPLFTGQSPAVVATLEQRIGPAVVIDHPHLDEPRGEVAGAWAPSVPEDPCLLLATSGSTGVPRLVTLTHGNLCSQQAAFAALWPEIGPDDRLAGHLPWHHSYGALAERLWALVRGAGFPVGPGEGRDRAALHATLAAVRPTVFMSVPRIHRELRLGDAIDRAPLRWAFTAGAPVDDAERAWYAAAGIPLYEGWGLTETSPSACITPPGESLVPGVVGRPIPGVTVGVRGDGRVLVRGPGVMAGYWRDPPATAAVLRDGVLDSGDLGCWDQAGLRLLGRGDHTCKLDNGEKVPVAELEAALAAQPGVRHAVVAVREDRVVAVLEAATPAVDLAAAIARYHATQPVGYLHLAAAWAVTRPLSVADGTLTASHKVVRAAVLARIDHGCGVTSIAW